MNRNAITITFEDVEGIIYQLCHDWGKKIPLSFDDLLSIAQEEFCIAYQLYDRSRGASFSTWVHNRLRWRFCNEVLRHDRTKDRFEYVPEELLPERESPTWSVREFCKGLSLDARLALIIAQEMANLHCLPGEQLRPQSIRKQVRRMLLTIGWERQRVNATFQEIREAL